MCDTDVTSIRLLADDLTGALDTAAEFVGMTGPVEAFWHGAIPAALPANAALDSGTRELDANTAANIVTNLAPALMDATVAFKKVDSLMRGPTFAEVAACMCAGGWRHGVMAPAFPYQGRATRGGIQHARDLQGGWSPVGGEIVARLRELGVQAQPGQPDAALPPGVSVFDAETDVDMDRVVTIGRAAGDVLWIGTGGLAQALARCSPAPAGSELPRPLLGLFGSDHAVTIAQLAACCRDWVPLKDASPAEVAAIATRLRGAAPVVASVDLPDGISRDDAAYRIGEALHRLIHNIQPPGMLLVAGGETLRGLCRSLGARSLVIEGRLMPGLPRSVLRGGVWDGVTLVSKSGAFGPPNLLRDLLYR